jgi:hypothetical protein
MADDPYADSIITSNTNNSVIDDDHHDDNSSSINKTNASLNLTAPKIRTAASQHTTHGLNHAHEPPTESRLFPISSVSEVERHHALQRM